ncbi:MAG: hypothetical protein AB8G77_22565 [Rhodothermales bacterium]
MHELEDERDPLQKQLANIEQIFQEFADQYDAAAQSLRNGLVPDPIPSIQLEAARKVVKDTFAAISEAGQPFEIEPLDEESSLSVAGEYLERVLEARARAEEIRMKIEEARLVISEVETLQHASDPEVLAQVSTSIEDLTHELDEKNLDVAEKLLSGEHALTMLAAYARHRDTLSDLEYDSFRESIQSHYGRSLLRDIDRGRVVFEQNDQVEHTVDFGTDNDNSESTVVIEEETDLLDEEEVHAPSPYDPISEIEIDEELLEEANIDVKEDSLPPLYSEYDSGEGEDTLLPFLEGDGMNFESDEMPEATVNTSQDDQEENDEENNF